MVNNPAGKVAILVLTTTAYMGKTTKNKEERHVKMALHESFSRAP